MKNEPFVIERTFHAKADRVWKALTDKDQMKQWYFKLDAFKPEVGFEFRFDGGNETRVYHHICKITEVVKEKKLQYSWRYDGFEGISLVTFELFPEGDHTKVRLTHEGIENFPPLPDFDKKNFVEGWTYIIGQSLKKYLGE